MRDADKPWHEKTEFSGAARFSDRLLKRSGAFVLVPPSVITAAGGLAAIPMFLAFLAGAWALGLGLFLFSLMTDWLDGALARYQARHLPDLVAADAERPEWFRLGPTEFGKKLDPVVDKLRYFLALFPLGWGVLPHAVIWTSLGIAVALTFFREVVRLRWGLKPGANAVGKIKVYVEAGAILLLTLASAGVPLGMPALVLFLSATALGAASLVTQAQSIRLQLKSRRP